MEKILFFDYDDTLSYSHQPISGELIAEIRRISQKHKVVIATGKTAYYIVGVLRQIGDMENVSIIGENGATIYSNYNSPPSLYCNIEVASEVEGLFSHLKKELISAYGQSNLWFPPNDFVLTVCPRFECQKEEIYEYFKMQGKGDFLVFKHRDSVEILPKNVNKATGIKRFLEMMGIDRGEVELYGFGDSSNDIKMFELCDHAHLIGGKIEYQGQHVKLSGENSLIEFLKSKF